MALGKVKAKKSHKQTVNEQDEFLVTTGSLLDRIVDNPKQFTIVVSAIIVVALLWILVDHLLTESRRAVGDQFYHAQKIFSASVAKSDEEYENLKKEKPNEPVFKSENEKYNAAINEFGKFLKDNPDGNLAGMAHFYVAVSQEKLGKPKAAEESISKALEMIDSEDPLHAVARKILGQVYEDQKQWEKALSQYRLLGEEKSGMLKDVALYMQARMLERLGKKKEAQSLYAKMLDEFPDSNFKSSAQKHKSVLDAELGTAAND